MSSFPLFYCVLYFASVSCWVCEDSDECANPPELDNNGNVPEGSSYSQVGCINGCWVC